MSLLASICPLVWAVFDEDERAWVGLAVAHAQCYLTAHHLQTQQAAPTPTHTVSVAQTATTALTATADGATTPMTTTVSSNANALLRGKPAAEVIALVGAVVVVLAHAA